MSVNAMTQQGDALWATERLGAEEFSRVRRQMTLEYCKWDPQMGDAGVLAPFALVMTGGTWQKLARWAEALWEETVAAEEELMRGPALWGKLGMPRGLVRILRRARVAGATRGAGRVMRFDFHETKEGWRISEVNSDVPGGFSEGSALPRLMAEALGSGARAVGDPGGILAGQMARAAEGRRVALICAAGFMEDRQVVSYLAKRLGALGCAASVCDLREIRWEGNRAAIVVDGREERVGAVLRFYQAEWLARLPRRFGWERLFAGGELAVCNPAVGVLSESKGFPLVWDRLSAQMETWRALLPETRGLSEVDWKREGRWVLKEKYSNNGDSVVMRECVTEKAWKRVCREAFWHPNNWVAQRRFEPVVLETPVGEMRACMGVYVIDGRAAGIYGRLFRGAMTDYSAMDVAVLVEGEEE